MSSKLNEGFQWVSNESSTPTITLDAHNRIYITKGARQLLDLPTGEYFRLIAGVDLANKRIVIAKPEIVKVPNVEPFNFDKRAYSSAKTLVEKARLEKALPVRFLYVGKDYSDYPQGSYVFQLDNTIVEDK